MWGTVVSTGIITLLIMFLLHQTYNHLQATLTVPKVSDLIKRPEEKYREIDNILDAKEVSKEKEKDRFKGPSQKELQPSDMKDELKTFLTLLRH